MNIFILLFHIDAKYFRLYNIFNAIKLAVDFGIIREQSNYKLDDPKLVN